MRNRRFGFNLKAFFFDLDGTLVDSATQVIESVIRTRSSLKYVQASESFIQSKIGLPAKELFSDLSLNESETVSAVTLFSTNLGELSLRQRDLFQGVPEFLQFLQENSFSLSVATNKPTNLAIQALTDTGIRHHFDFVIGGENNHPKPSPEIILKCLELKSLQAKEAVMVGDRVEDVLAAKAAGVFAVGIEQGVHKENEFLNCGADHSFQSILKFYEWFKEGVVIENL